MADRAAHLAGLLLDGLRALQAGDPSAAVAPLTTVCDDVELARAADMSDVRARACSLLAQALLEVGRPEDATPWVETAIQLARRAGDPDGLRHVEALREQIGRAAEAVEATAQRTARSERLATVSVEQIESKGLNPSALVEILIRKANADLDAGGSVDALPIALRAKNAAIALGDVRLEVLARLSVARADPSQALEELEQAHKNATAANEFNLVTAVARAADAHGVQVGVLHGPGTKPS